MAKGDWVVLCWREGLLGCYCRSCCSSRIIAIGGWVELGWRERLVRVVIVGWVPWSMKWRIIVFIIITTTDTTTSPSCICTFFAVVYERGRLPRDDGCAIRSPSMLVGSSLENISSPTVMSLPVQGYCNHNTKQHHKASKRTSDNQSDITLLLVSTSFTIWSATTRSTTISCRSWGRHFFGCKLHYPKQGLNIENKWLRGMHILGHVPAARPSKHNKMPVVVGACGL